jgi:parallel beta-helix repeat protein
MDKRCGILIVSVMIFVLCFVGTASATNWSVDGSGGADFTGIQDAINNAKAGDTILVYSGIYYENVVVDKSVTLKGLGYPIVDAGGEGNAIRLTADGITLVGFTATNSGILFVIAAGIMVTSNNNSITGNNACNNGEGIRLTYSSNNNTITGNNVSNNSNDGIRLFYSSNNNTITDNNVSNNNGDGIHLTSSSNNNTITGNNVSNNSNNGIYLPLSSNNTITDNNVSNNGDGIYLLSGNNNTITGNNVSNNNYGIYLLSGNNNTITGNNVSNNNYGIYLWVSSNNSIYLNNFINNTDNVDSLYSSNIWNSPEEITYTYDGSTYESYVGNYWDDYEGTDADGDGIGDTSYSIDSDSDESDDYPLMKPFENYNITTSHE